MYGGFDTTTRAISLRTGASNDPCRISTGACNAPAMRAALARATSTAPVDTSVAITRSNAPSPASASAIAPEPVPTSTASPPARAAAHSSTTSTSTSVSCRGMRTRSSTSSVRWRNAARPTAYANGAPRARRAAASHTRISSDSSSSASGCRVGQKRGLSATAAIRSRASASGWSISFAANTRATVRRRSSTNSPWPAPNEARRGPMVPATRALDTELLLDVGQHQAIDQLVQIAVQRPIQLVQREADAMVGHPILRKIVRADLGRPVARPHLRATHARPLRFLLRQPLIQQPRAQHLERLELVLQLRLLVLLAHDDSGRDVRDAHGGVGGVHALATRTRGPEHVDADVLVLDRHVDFLRLRQHGHRGRRGVDASRALGDGHALHAMHTRFPAQPAVRALALHL